jgi:tripartite-type tricarboxylate transporter receptor subunit TctC
MMRIAAIIVFTLTALVTGASAQEPYPSRPISIVNPFQPGGIADLTGRPRPAHPTCTRAMKLPAVSGQASRSS